MKHILMQGQDERGKAVESEAALNNIKVVVDKRERSYLKSERRGERERLFYVKFSKETGYIRKHMFKASYEQVFLNIFNGVAEKLKLVHLIEYNVQFNPFVYFSLLDWAYDFYTRNPIEIQSDVYATIVSLFAVISVMSAGSVLVFLKKNRSQIDQDDSVYRQIYNIWFQRVLKGKEVIEVIDRKFVPEDMLEPVSVYLQKNKQAHEVLG